jgi:hypothetical protein
MIESVFFRVGAGLALDVGRSSREFMAAILKPSPLMEAISNLNRSLKPVTVFDSLIPGGVLEGCASRVNLSPKKNPYTVADVAQALERARPTLPTNREMTQREIDAIVRGLRDDVDRHGRRRQRTWVDVEFEPVNAETTAAIARDANKTPRKRRGVKAPRDAETQMAIDLLRECGWRYAGTKWVTVVREMIRRAVRGATADTWPAEKRALRLWCNSQRQEERPDSEPGLGKNEGQVPGESRFNGRINSLRPIYHKLRSKQTL